jgi:hypothetical protein
MWRNFYKTYTIKGLREAFFGARIKLTSKEEFKLDKMNWVLNHIISSLIYQDLPLDHFVNIHSRTLRKYIGSRNYHQIMKELEANNFIVANNKYSSNSFSKSYSLTPISIESGIVETKYASKKFIKSFERIIDDDYKSIVKNALYRKIMFNTSKLMVYELALHYQLYLMEIEASLAQTVRYDSFYETFDALSVNISPKAIMNYPIFFKPSLSVYGRVYHIAASIPKMIRASMRTMDNELIWEVDMTSAQLSLLMLEWLNQEKKKLDKGESTSPLKELRECFNVLLSGNLYLHLRNSSDDFKKLSKEEFKLAVLKALNAKVGSHFRVQETLCNVFPSFMGWVNHIKKNQGYKKVAQLGQKLESELFIETYKRIPESMFALPIHDCIITTKEHTYVIKELLMERSKEMFSSLITNKTTLANLFKVSQVSLSNENTLRWSYEMFQLEEYFSDSQSQ